MVKLNILPLVWISFGIHTIQNIKGQMGPCPQPKNFPSQLSLSLQPFSTYSKEFKLPHAYVVTARNAREVVSVANWAYKEGYRVRAIGSKHSWAPLTYASTDSSVFCPKIILVDTTKYLTSMRVNPTDPGRPDLNSVTVGPGVKLEALLKFLESNGFGLFASPTVGPVTVGGMIAIGAHGSGIPATLDYKSTGHTYGSFSNLIIELVIVAWNKETNSYDLKTVHRSEPDAKAFLTNLGRTFVTLVTFRVGLDQNLRTQSTFYISTRELYAHPRDVKESTRTIQKYATSYGRTLFFSIGSGADALAWVVNTKVEPIKPQRSQWVTKPFNYLLQNVFPQFLDPFLHGILRAQASVWKIIAPVLYNYLVIGTKVALAHDYWGPSKNHLLFVQENLPSFQPSSFTVLTSVENLQLVVHLMRSNFVRLARQLELETGGEFFMAGEFNMRITGVDDPMDVEIPGAEAPSLSNARPMPNVPEYKLIVWLELSSYYDIPHMYKFKAQLQKAFYKDIHGTVGILRVEWPKAWAHTETGGPWTNSTIIKHFAQTFSSSDKLEEWNWAVTTLTSYDPHKIFSNDFLDQLLAPQL